MKYTVLWKTTEYASFKFKDHAEAYIEWMRVRFSWTERSDFSIVAAA